MMDNAATEGTRLGLTVGQELTQEQINNLNEDIVWYVTKNVNGVEVLTPQVYLSSKTRESISDDIRNRVGGINGTYVKTKDFVNDGTKWGNGGVTYVEANTVRNETTTNLLSEISGDRTFINSVGNIENIGGRINGEEAVALISEKGNVINDTTKRTVGFNNGEYDRAKYEEVASVGAITSKGTTFIKADSYSSTGGVLNTSHLVLDVNNFDENALSLSGNHSFGTSGSNYSKYAETTHLGAGTVANSVEGRVGNLNLKGSSFIAEDTTGLTVGNIKAESVVNSYDMESKQSSKGFMSSSSTYRNSHMEENSASNLMLGKNAIVTGNVEGIGSNIVLGENTYVGGKVTTDSRELHNSYYEENKKKGFTGGISHGTISAGYGKSSSTYDEKSTVNAKSNLQIGDGSVLNNGAEITATNFEYGNIQINNGDVKYGARIDTRDVHTESKSSSFGVSIGISSPALDRAKQVGQAISQVRNGDTAGGAMEAINAATGTINGLALNQGNRQTNYDANGSVGAKGARDAQANSNFYANIGVNAGFTRSQSSSDSHTEGAAVTTLKPMDENSGITYNNVNNITYQGTQAQGGTFIYNNVANIQKEAVELHNSYNSSSSSMGISAGATIGYGHKLQTTGNGGSISTSRSNQNTVETVYANGNFNNVNEVHNNTGSMVLNGFNQEGGKVTGNIGKLEVISKQNTSTTTGSSRGMSLGISANGVPSSVNINGSRTNGDRAFVDNQSTFIIGEGSTLHVGTLENTGAVIGKEGNSTFKIDNYVGKDIQNHDTMKTTGGSLGISTGKPRITNVGFNQDSRDKQGITRNTVIGNVEIGETSGSPINRDITRANEVTKDTHSSTNINVESQTIEYATNPAKLKEDIGKAKKEISDVTTAIKESINDRGDDNRNFFGQLREMRLNETIGNIAGERLDRANTQKDIKDTLEAAYKDLGYNVEIRFSTPSETPELDGKGGTAYVGDDGKHTVIINSGYLNGKTKGEILGVISEEASHVINGAEGRQIATGTDEKGLESTGRATNEYFKDKYKDDDTTISLTSEGAIDTSKLGTNVGDRLYLSTGDNRELNYLLRTGKEFLIENFSQRFKGGQRGSEILKAILNDGGILSKDITPEEEKKVLTIFQEDNKDKLDIVTNSDGSKEIIIIQEEANYIKDDYEREKTLRVREILNSNIKFIVQPTEEKNIFEKEYSNNKWNEFTSAVNQTILTQNDKVIADVIFYNFDYNDKNKRTYFSIDDKGKMTIETYKNSKPEEQHELVIHPSDIAMENKGNFKYLSNARNIMIDYEPPKNDKNKSENIEKNSSSKVIYFEDQYVKIKNEQGKTKYVLQPFKIGDENLKGTSEVNTVINENAVMKRNGDNTRPRFYYQEDLERYKKEFDSLEDLKNFFDNRRE